MAGLGDLPRPPTRLTILLSPHAEGDAVRYSELFPALRALDISCERVADVLTEMGVLLDDRPPIL